MAENLLDIARELIKYEDGYSEVAYDYAGDLAQAFLDASTELENRLEIEKQYYEFSESDNPEEHAHNYGVIVGLKSAMLIFRKYFVLQELKS